MKINVRRTSAAVGAAPALLLAALLLGGCASTPPPPNDALQAAELAISHAEQVSASQYAPSDIGTARQELASARDAVKSEDMVSALRFAELSRTDADLAAAKASAAKARAVNDDMQKGTDALKQEMHRNTGAPQ